MTRITIFKITKVLLLSFLLLGLISQSALMADGTNPSVSLTPSLSTIVYGTSIRLSGTVNPAHTGQQVSIYKTPVGEEEQLLANVNQSSSGTYSYTVSPTKNTSYRSVYNHDGTPTSSAYKKVTVKPKVNLAVSKTRVYVNEPLTLTAAVIPSRAGKPAVIEQLISGSWKVIKTGNLNTQSKLIAAIKPAAAKRYYFRARYLASNDAQYAANISAKKTVIADKPFAVVHSQFTKYPEFGFAQKDTHTARVDVVYKTLTEEFGGYSAKKITDSDVASLSTLRKYKVVIFPAVTCVSKAQREAIRSYVKEGGRIIASFGLARNDYDGYPLIWRYQFKSSWDLSRFWEWAEISEIFQLKFNNDPLMSPGYKVNSGSSTHPIIASTKKDLGISTISMKSSLGGYNELNWSMKNNPNVVPILTFDTKSNGTTADDSSNGYKAAWVSKYYKGISVYYNFMLHDYFWSGHKDSGNGNLAVSKRLFINSVKWLRDSSTTGKMTKTTNPTAASWLSGYTGYSINVKQTVANTGAIQLRGAYFVEIYKPGVLLYRGQTSEPVPLGPATSWTYNAWRYYIGKPAATNYTVRVGSYLYDATKGGMVRSYRDYVYKYSSGSLSMVSVGPVVISK